MGETRVSIWNLTEYLTVHYQLRAGSFAYAALTLCGVLLCIFSPIMLILLGGLQEYGKIAVSENLAGGLGLRAAFEAAFSVQGRVCSDGM